jgi:rubrerythrin
MKGEYMKGQEILGQKMKGEDMMEPMMDQFMKNDYMTGQHMQDYMDDEESQTSMVEALRLIKEAVEGEAEDRMFYDYLIRNARSEKDREIITGIRDDEIKHAKMFRQLYYELTGHHIRPDTNVNFQRPKTYCDGLIRALMGEQNAVRKYRRILFAMKERRHINTLTEIITDEIRHATLYNLMINNNECRY